MSEKTGKSKKITIIIVALVAIIVASVILGYFFLQKKNITEAQAKEIVLNDAGITMTDADIMTISYDKEDNDYDIEFSSDQLGKRFEYTVNARNGKIINKEEESVFINKPSSENITQNDQAITGNTVITEDKAKEIAISKAGFSMNEVTFVQTEFDVEDNRYDIDFIATDKNSSVKYKYEYDISASDGTVISEQKDKDLT